jgi:hypothetical protein
MAAKKEPSKIGRPRIIDSPETFDRLVDSYIDMCRKANEPVLLTGLVLALGLTCKDSLYEYGTYPEFSESVKRARTLVEMEYEKRLNSGSNAAAPIFALKNFGWRDKPEDENKSAEAIADALRDVFGKLPD